MSWSYKIEKLKRRYYPRISSLLSRLRRHCEEELGLQVGVIEDLTDDEFCWSFVIHPNRVTELEVGLWHESDVSVEFRIFESMAHEGTEDGVNFGLSVEIGNHPTASICPYNYTEECWVPLDDHDELERRLRIIENDARWTMEDTLRVSTEGVARL